MTYSNNYQTFNALAQDTEAVEITIKEDGYAYVIDDLFNSVKIKKENNNRFFLFFIFEPNNYEKLIFTNSHVASSSLNISYYYKNGNINKENHMLIMTKEKPTRDVFYCLDNLRIALEKKKTK